MKVITTGIFGYVKQRYVFCEIMHHSLRDLI